MDNVEYGHNECCIWTTTNHLFFLHLISPCPFLDLVLLVAKHLLRATMYEVLNTCTPGSSIYSIEHSRELDVIVCVRNADGSALLNTNPINRRTLTESK